jgi:preprotein translocase subunit SecE
VTQQAEVTKRIGSRFRFIGEVTAELKKVVWLSRREIVYLSAVVLIVSVAAGAFLGIFDYVFTALVENLLGR